MIAILDNNQKINFEEDVLRLKLDYLDTKNQQNKNDFFGIVQKSIKLKEDDNRVMEVVKSHLKNLSYNKNIPSYSSSFSTTINKENNYNNQYQIYEFYIYVKYRRYIENKNSPIEYEVKKFISLNFQLVYFNTFSKIFLDSN